MLPFSPSLFPIHFLFSRCEPSCTARFSRLLNHFLQAKLFILPQRHRKIKGGHHLKIFACPPPSFMWWSRCMNIKLLDELGRGIVVLNEEMRTKVNPATVCIKARHLWSGWQGKGSEGNTRDREKSKDWETVKSADGAMIGERSSERTLWMRLPSDMIFAERLP